MKKKLNVKRLILALLLLSQFIVSMYAWFTSNTLVKVETLDINVQTSEGLQISVDAVNWKTILTRDDIITGGDWNNHLNHISENKDIKPVSTIGEVNSEGFLRMFVGTVDFDFISNKLALVTEELSDTPLAQEYIAFDIFLKTNQPFGSLSLDISSSVIGGANPSGYTKGLENAVRVGFIKQGHVEMNNYESANGVDRARAMRNCEQVVIWEPNSDSHTLAAINDAFNAYNVSIGPYDVVSSYSGVKNTITKPIPLKDVNFINEPNYFGEIRAGTNQNSSVNFIQTPKPLKNEAGYRKGQALYYNNLGGEGVLDKPESLGIELPPGVTKVRIYMWVEGQDYDCEDFAPGTDLQFNLSFIAERT